MSDQNEPKRDRIERASDDELERLLRMADPGPVPPGDGAGQLKAALRPIWQATVQARRARRRKMAFAGVSLAAAAAVAALVLLWPTEAIRPLLPVGTIERVEGLAATLSAPDQPPATIRPASSALEIAPLQRIDTGDATRVAVRLSNGASLRLDQGTSIILESTGSLMLLQGAAYLDTDDGRASILVRTPLGTARDLGTRFEVRLAPRVMTVRVRGGLVAVDSDGRTEVRAGMQGTFVLDEEPILSPIAPDASEWAWAQSIAPPFTLEGRTAAEFLEWVGRETGRTITYVSDEALRRATGSVLHGDLAGVPPAAAPEIVLPSAGLTAERDPDGAFRIGLAGVTP